MKTSALFLGAIAQVASAHYFFDTTVRGGVADRQWQYVREFTRPTAYNPIKFSSNPPADIRDNSFIDGEDARCNQGAFTNAGKTDVLTVKAGSEVTVKLGVGATMQHPGPSLVYLSRAPNDDVKSYDGSGKWFKIFQEGVCNKGGDFTKDAWCSWDKNTITARIPLGTPSGQYLFRAEHIGIHRSHVNQPEHFVSCVQIEVTDGGSGVPTDTVEFPGAYKDTDEYANFSIYGGFKDFPFPGPPVWSGAGSSSAGTGGASTSSAPPAASTTEAAEAVQPTTPSTTEPAAPVEEPSDVSPAPPVETPAPPAGTPIIPPPAETPVVPTPLPSLPTPPVPVAPAPPTETGSAPQPPPCAGRPKRSLRRRSRKAHRAQHARRSQRTF
ncbi:hypothetical protein NLU13_9399 [Sarocladium strictum]|uniref:lytic cellulose monooxygenase (C4-dehydrogenating) n=1 Tax=Sarocladium strictum TaxID=5046 RepID=A0AA39GB59_SARSR|nr:hypothetical protein NLU13_9399 [Sarocladium strictum]